MSDEALVRAQSVSKTYIVADDPIDILRSITLEVLSGDLLAITGPSGSGKTTLLHVIAGLETPSTGRLDWPALGERGDLMPSKVGIAFQTPSLLPALDILENVCLPLLLRGESDERAKATAQQVLGELDLEEFETKLPEQLSGGQVQRVAVARAFAAGPRLILADEPTGQQDRAGADQLMSSFLRLARDAGAALIIATHDRSVAALFDRKLSLHDGALREEEPLRRS